MIGVRVLIVDDSLTIRAMLEQIISGDGGCEVVGVAADAAAALPLMTSSRADVVTLDLNMPGIDGLQFLRHIADARHPPVVIVSSTSQAGGCRAARKVGAVAWLDKASLLADVPQFLRKLKKAAATKPPHISASGGTGSSDHDAEEARWNARCFT